MGNGAPPPSTLEPPQLPHSAPAFGNVKTDTGAGGSFENPISLGNLSSAQQSLRGGHGFNLNVNSTKVRFSSLRLTGAGPWF